MHEVSMAMSIVDAVVKKAEEYHATAILKVEIEIGQLTFLNPEQVEFWVEQGLAKTLGAGAELRVAKIEPKISCKACGYWGPLKIEDDPAYHLMLPVFACPKCDSPDVEIAEGRGCLIRSIEVSTGEDG